MKKTLKEFKDFAVKGNVIDLAVAVVIGGAFGKIVSSFVTDIITPIIGYLIGGVNFKNIFWVLKPELIKDLEIIEPAIIVNLGVFIQNIFDFLIIAISIFFAIKMLSRLKKKIIIEKDKEEVKVGLSKDQELLSEIRDLLKIKNNK